MYRLMIVGLGGALGAMGRYSIGMLPIKTGFPWLTLMTNFIGSLLIGFIAGIGVQNGMGKEWELFWKTGICGGFTTFSAFSLEAWRLLESGKTFMGMIYILLSVMLSITGAAAGQYFGRKLMQA